MHGGHALYREWSSRVSCYLKVLVRNLTLDVGSNQATEQPPFVGANFVPKAVRKGLGNRLPQKLFCGISFQVTAPPKQIRVGLTERVSNARLCMCLRGARMLTGYRNERRL